MDFAHAVLAILVKRLGGRVELPVNEIEAMGGRGEELVSYKDGLAFQYVLELREPPTPHEPDAAEQQIKPSELLYLTTDPRETPLALPPWTRDDPEMAKMIDEGHARRREARHREDRRCSPTPSGYPTVVECSEAASRELEG